MKKTQWIDLWTTIRRNRIPYIAIVIFVALGIALYAGMSWSCTFINTSMTATCNEGRLAHMRVVYPYGISDEQMAELQQIDGVDEVEGYNYIYRFFDLNGEQQQAAVYQLTEHIGAPVVVAGTLPVNSDEIAVLSSWAEQNHIGLGDTVTFQAEYGSDYREVRPVTAIAAWDPEGDDEPDTSTSDPGYLASDTFTVTALVESPEYIMTMKGGYGTNLMNGDQVDAIMFVSKEAMDPSLFNGYTSAAIYSETLAAKDDGSTAYRAAYDDLLSSVTAVTQNWTDVPDSYNSVLARFSQLLQNAAKQISDAIAQINEKQTELDEGQQAVTDGENTLAEKQQEYDNGKAQYSAGLAEANSAADQLASAWKAYDCLQQDIAAANELIDSISAFRDVMAEEESSGDEQPSGGDEQTTGGDEQTSGEPTAGGDQASAADTAPADESVSSTAALMAYEAPVFKADTVPADESVSFRAALMVEIAPMTEEEPASAAEQTSSDQPAASDNQSASSDSQPSASDSQPTVSDDNQPASSDNQSAGENPAGGDTQPSTGGQTAGDEQSSGEGEQPSDGDEQPSDEGEQPSGEDEQPSGGDGQPSGEDEQPSGGDEQPSGGDEQPSGEDKPSGGDQSSQAEKRQAAADAVKASASKLLGLVNSQSSQFAALKKQIGTAVDTSGLSAAASRVMNSSTPEELLAALDEAEAQLEGSLSDLENLPAKLYKKLSSAQDELDWAYNQLNAAAAQLADGLRQLTEGRAKLDDAIAQLAEGRQALSDARTELAAKQSQYDEAQEKYLQMDTAAETVYEVMPSVFTRSSNISLITADGAREVLLSGRTTLASLFLIVAVLVGYSTLARMVADTSLQIGTKKALGFTRWETLRLYLLYAFSAALIGALLGTVGAFGVEAMFNSTFVNMYQVKELPAVFQPLPVLIPFFAELVMLTAVVALATLRQLNRKAIDLLKGTSEAKAPKSHTSRFAFFRNMPLLDRIIFTNLRQDKRRVIAMLIGIGGSAMLVTAGLTCLINLSRSIGVQYTKYYQFDTIVRYDPTSETASSELRTLLDKYGASYAEVIYTHVLTDDPNGSTRIPDVFVPVDTEELAHVMRFANENNKNTDYTGGLWVADSYYDKLGVKTGDTVLMQSLTGDKAELPVCGFYKNYLPTLTMVIDMDTWQSAYPGARANAYLVKTDGIDSTGLQAELNALDGYICSVAFRENSESSFSAILAIIAAIACIFSVMAVLLLIMLLVNLLDMYISEKKRELIILKINGYPGKKVREYIWKDTLLLTVFGILIGVVLGTVEGNFTQSSLEGSNILMYHGISWGACAAAGAVTALMALVITLVELKKIDRFRLSDINN